MDFEEVGFFIGFVFGIWGLGQEGNLAIPPHYILGIPPRLTPGTRTYCDRQEPLKRQITQITSTQGIPVAA